MNTLEQTLSLLHAGQWNAAHQRVQDDPSALGAWLHGILHVVEGDLEDAEYWYGQAGRSFHGRGTLAEEIRALESALAARGTSD